MSSELKRRAGTSGVVIRYVGAWLALDERNVTIDNRRRRVRLGFCGSKDVGVLGLEEGESVSSSNHFR
jgi:hypothetical protein